jgi:cell division septation protein DedD
MRYSFLFLIKKKMIFVACIFFPIFFLLSCATKTNQEKIRIIDADGNPVNIKKMIPKFNEQQIVKQRMAISQQQLESSSKRVEVNKFVNQEGYEQNKTSFDVNDYPDDIFADRITNYNYMKTNEDNKIIANKKNDNIEIIDNKINNNKNLNNNIYIDNNIDISPQKVDNNMQIDNKPLNSTIKNDKNNNDKIKISSKASKTIKNDTKKLAIDKGFYIQIGSYTNESSAKKIYDKYKNVNIGKIDKKNGKYRVLLGHYDNKKNAEKDMEKIIKMGHYDVYITEQK